jgi:hypothetical protein
MANAVGLSYSSVQRIWRARGLKPHLIETFKISRDENFAKVEDVVWLYLNPSDKRWSFASMKKAKSRRSISPNSACR